MERHGHALSGSSRSFLSTRKPPIGPGILISKSYYWHRFFSHQPDLNFDNPAVFETVWEVMKFWLDLGVDGFRLDAVAYLVEREGTLCENLPETHAIIRELRQPSGLGVSRDRCSWPRQTNGRRTSAPISATMTNSTRHFIFP